MSGKDVSEKMEKMNRKLSTVFTLLLALFFVFKAFPARGITIEFSHLFSFGKFGSGKEQFDHPLDVVEDSHEDLYILDSGNYRVQKVDYRGDYITEWGKRGIREGEFDRPRSLVIDDDDNIYVVDTGNHRIQKFSSDGDFLMEFGGLGQSRGRFRRPTDLAIDREGNFYVVDAGNRRIQKFDSNWKFVQEWGRFERRGRELKDPFSIAYADEGFGYLYVFDREECEVLKFDRTGILKDRWEVLPPGKGYICGPMKIRVEPRNYYVYIADTGNGRVVVFNRSGREIGEIEEKLKEPAGLFVNDSEEVFIVDRATNKIHKFRRD
ncbi:MAG: hypothetical protein D6713_08730 [Deltaproteobacteria bacterium]|nr:MAG: hypothetical protein D6713_08730 [Deltaproteobacteria bacterium]